MPAETKKEAQLATMKKIQAIQNRRTVLIKKLEDLEARLERLVRGK